MDKLSLGYFLLIIPPQRVLTFKDLTASNCLADTLSDAMQALGLVERARTIDMALIMLLNTLQCIFSVATCLKLYFLSFHLPKS